MIEAVDRIRGPFNVSGPALAAGIAAIADDAHVEAAIAHNEEWLPRLDERDRRAGPRRDALASATSC